ncbi:hypothetical protein B7463_g92, partial [Scytalidium lignicola]
MDSRIPNHSSNLRRIPPDLRKRAALSCDLCKTRRRKCVRSVSGDNCQLCKENQVSCITTIARKQRSHTPMKDLPPSHIVIEQLVARLFPRVATRDLNQLIKLADCLEKYNVEIHCVDDRITVSADPIDILSSASHMHQYSRERIATPPPESPPTPTSRGDHYERILQNSSGTLSYFGPSSSMAFVMQLREELVLNENQSQNLESLQPTQRRLRKDFAADKYCCTMEKAPTMGISDTDPQGHVHPDQYNLGNGDSTGAQSAPRPNRPQSFVDCLPLRQQVDELVELFFIHIHPNMALFHRPLFQSALEDLWACDKPESQDVGWMVCCCVVLVFGCEHIISTSTNKSASHIQDVSNLQRKLLELALGKVTQLILSATLQSVQSFALLSLYLNATNQRNASWIMMGCAIRMAISLGMHRGDKLLLQRHIRLTPIERELRKRVWWTLYIFEQYHSALFGRPSAIDDEETTSDLPIESILDEGYHRPPGLIAHDVSLAKIVSKIRKSQADHGRFSSLGGHGFSDCHTVHGLLQELDTWYDDLPPFLKFDESNQRHIYPSHFRQLVTLQLRYQHARLLLARPFHLKILQNPLPTVQDGVVTDIVAKFGDICVGAALESWKLTSILWESGKLDGNLWLDGVFAYQSGMVLSLACLDTRQRLSTSNRKDFESAVEGILKILRQFPPNKPMSRLVQIADDFSSIVRAMRPCPTPPTTGEQHRYQQLLPQTPHSSSTDEALVGHQGMPINQPGAEVTSVALEDMQSSWSPPLPPNRHDSTVDDISRCESSFTWGFEGAELIDSMLDWNFPQAFGFDDGKSYSTF